MLRVALITLRVAGVTLAGVSECLQELAAPRRFDGVSGARDLGDFIRDLRRNARISLRELAQRTGVSNPYLSQIERGLRKPSAEVLQQIASALRVSTPVMYLRAGLLGTEESPSVLAAIAADSDLTTGQKQALSQIYETFRRENARTASNGDEAPPAEADPTTADEPTEETS